jgi:FixJ family two-component response regulator
VTETAKPKPNVYVIDDDPSVRSALVRFLLANGMEVLAFDTAEAFLAQLPQLAPGSLIVDVQLPGMSGLDLLTKMACDNIRWPALVLSGAHEGNEAAVAALLGPNRYLRKPFDPKIVLQALHLSPGGA